MSRFQRPRGTRDFTPEEMEFRNWALTSMKKAIASFGYREVSTPTFESLDLFVEKSGQQVIEQVYSFTDKGGRNIALRPELTAPVMRFYDSDLRNRKKPLRISYFGNCFRYERPQKGRYREFWQFGLEYIGKRTPLALSEVIEASISALLSVGMKDFQVRIGHVSILYSLIGSMSADPQKDRDLMIAIDKKDEDSIRRYVRDNLERDPEDLIRLVTTTYDRKNGIKILEEIRADNPEMESDAGELIRVLEIVGDSETSIRMDPSISRGLDYYDGVVFEIDAPDLGAEKQICGGGAYSLTSVFDKEVEGIGFGLGFDRILVALDRDQKEAEDGISTYIMPMGYKAESKAQWISRELRDRGVKCIMETAGRNFKKAISSAVSEGCSTMIIMGDNEIEKNTVSVKDLRSKEQVEVPMDRLVERILDQ